MALCLLPGHLALNQVQEVILPLPKQDNRRRLNQKMIKTTREQQQIQFSNAVSIADRIVNHLQTLAHRLLKMRLQRGLQRDQEPEMEMSEDDEAIHLPLVDVIGIPPQEKGDLHPLADAGVALLLHPDAADLLLPDEGHHLHLSEDDLHLLDVTLLLFSAAIVLHLCHLKKENCLALPQDALLQGPNADLPGHPNGGALQLKGAALLPPRHLRPDTGGAQCTHLVDQKGIAVHLHRQQTAVAIQEALPVHMGVLKRLHPTTENRGLQITNQFEEYLEHQNLVMSRELPLAHSLSGEFLLDLGQFLLSQQLKNVLPLCLHPHHHHALPACLHRLQRRPAVVLPVSLQTRIQM